MRIARDVGEPAALADRFVRWTRDGRGDVARGRNLFALRLLDALWDPDSPLTLAYRPSRNPGAFLVMVIDIVGDALHGYGALIDESDRDRDAALANVRAHVSDRLSSPWPTLADELRMLGFDHLARVTDEMVIDALHRPAVSDLPELLAALPSWMTEAQLEAFDAERFVATLPLARVLSLLRYDDAAARSRQREQHASGGDVRALIRRRLDPAWRFAMDTVDDDLLPFLASWPFDVVDLADASEGEDFAVAYALATDAPYLGRAWSAPAPFVRDAERSYFVGSTGRGSEFGYERRTTRLRRWGVSATLPSSVALLDDRLETTPGLECLHAHGPWRECVRASRDTLAVERRRFVERVAEALRAMETP